MYGPDFHIHFQWLKDPDIAVVSVTTDDERVVTWLMGPDGQWLLTPRLPDESVHARALKAARERFALHVSAAHEYPRR